MRLANLRLRNFRCYRNEVSIDICKLTALIGRNDSGKSTVMEALRIFFEEDTPDGDDASIRGDKSDVRIICEFDQLPTEIVVDANYKTNLHAEYLLNSDQRLEIHRVYNCSLKTPKLSGVFANAVHPGADRVNDLLTLKRKDLITRANDLGVDLAGVDERVNAQIRQAIWAATGNVELCTQEIPLDQEGTKQIWEQLKKSLPAFSLFKSDRPSTDQDAEAQDPMKAAVKEAIKAKETELKSIADFVETEVRGIADKTVEKLREMDPALASQLTPRFTPPNWANVFKISLTGDDEIPVNKRGSGVRRLILLNFFRAKAEQTAAEKNAPGVIYAIEEPEASQHPDNQKMLMDAFAELSEQPHCQVILSTHTPMLARILPTETLRYISVEDDQSRVIHTGDEETNRLVARALGVLPDHGVKLFIGVEGRHDINFLRTISHTLAQAGEDLPDLEALETQCEIIFIPLGGSNLALWASRLAGLNRPEFHLFDRDESPPKQSPHLSTANAINARERCKAAITGKRELENYLHPDAIRAARPEVGITFGGFDDVPAMAAQAIHAASDSNKAWAELDDEKKEKKTSRAKRWLNTYAVEAMTAELLTQSDPSGDVRGWLTEIKTLLET